MIMWAVEFTNKAEKQLSKLPPIVQEAMFFLAADIKEKGPQRYDWPNFSKLDKNTYHCHIKKGRPTYVACWSIEDKKAQIVEVYYVGSHEGAPY